MFDPRLFKKQFPIFDQQENASLIYLDNAATTQKPKMVVDEIVDFYTKINANANRSSHRLARAATEKVVSTRKQAAKFINAENTESIVFTSGATESVNIIANGIGSQLRAGDEIVLSLAEHHANFVPWQEIAKKTGAGLSFIAPDFSNWEALLNKHVKVVSITAASNALGTISDLSIVKKIKKYNPDITVIIDAAQLVAHKKIDVVEIGCDFLLFSAHKMYGPTGLGVLYGRYEQLTKLKPLTFGGEMISRVNKYNSNYVEGPERFEAGTSPLSAIAGFGAAIKFISAYNRADMEEHEKKLIIYLHGKLVEICADYPDIRLFSCANQNIGVATLGSNQVALADLAYWLDEQDIAVRVGDHCAQPLWAQMDHGQPTLRISIAAYNDHDDIDKLIVAIADFLKLSENEDKNRREQCGVINIDELVSLKTWQKKYKKIVEWGKYYHVEHNIRTDENRISGCEAPLWLEVKKKGDRQYFLIDSDSNVVKGLSLLIVDHVNSKTAEEIRDVDFLGYFSKLGLSKYLSESRVSGLQGLIKKLRGLI